MKLFPNKKYDIIVCDPPWQLKKIKRKIRPKQFGFDYPTMTVDQIKNLPINNLTKDHTWLFLWTTQKYLFQSKEILEHWGFNYLCMSVWQKTFGKSAGMPLFGYLWNAEFICIGYKNKPTLYRKGEKLIPLVFQAENIKHSKKPDKFYSMIENLGNDRIDLFARDQRNGWDVWGNEVEHL